MSATTPERGRHGATLAVETMADAALLRIGGELDTLTVPDLHARIHDAVAATSGAVVADLTEVRFLSSSGLTLLRGQVGLQAVADHRPRPGPGAAPRSRHRPHRRSPVTHR